MASVIQDPNGNKRIQWCVDQRHRRTLRLGAVSLKQAQAVKVRIEQIITAQLTGIMDHEAAAWVGGLDDTMHGKLARLGLFPPRERTAPTLGGLLDQYFTLLSVKPGTIQTYGQTRQSLEDHFGKSRPLKGITPLDGDRWRKSMQDEGLAEATIAKRAKTARQIFARAVRWKMLADNPLEDIKTGSQSNRTRMRYISRADAQKVLDACPDAQWRLIVALSRFGGLRCPSEVMPLRWSDINFETGTITVRSCKTEGYAGKEQRSLPLFPELREHLLAAFAEAEEGAEFVITRYRSPGCNLRTQMLRIIARAGLAPWPKPFHNLRSTRQTELCEEYPSHVSCRWLGNTTAVAVQHYLQVTDEHHRRAVAGTGGSGGGGGTGGAPQPGPASAQRPATGANVAAPAAA